MPITFQDSSVAAPLIVPDVVEEIYLIKRLINNFSLLECLTLLKHEAALLKCKHGMRLLLIGVIPLA